MNWSLYSEKVKTLFEYFNANDYVFFIIFALSIIYILITEKEKKLKLFFSIYSMIIMCIIFNPIAIMIFEKMINFSSIYRIYYMLPLCITIAYAVTNIISKIKSKKWKYAALILIISFIVLVGESVYAWVTQKVGTLYKLPDEVIQVATIIMNDAETECKRAIVPYGMSSQIGQVTSKIELLYTRVVTNEKDENGNSSPLDTEDIKYCEPALKLSEGDIKYIAELANKSKYNYVVYYKHTPAKDETRFEQYGFELMYQTPNYLIYRNINSLGKTSEEYKQMVLEK